jgi:hypothetical protein
LDADLEFVWIKKSSIEIVLRHQGCTDSGGSAQYPVAVIDIVDLQVKQGTSTGLSNASIGPASPGRTTSRLEQNEQVETPQSARIDALLKVHVGVVEANVMGHHEDQVSLFGQIDQLLALLYLKTEWLF